MLQQSICLLKIIQLIPRVSHSSVKLISLTGVRMWLYFILIVPLHRIYFDRYGIRVFFRQWLFGRRIRLFARFGRFLPNHHRRTCAHSLRDATLPDHSTHFYSTTCIAISSKIGFSNLVNDPSSHQVVTASSTCDSCTSAWMDCNALVRVFCKQKNILVANISSFS